VRTAALALLAVLAAAATAVATASPTRTPAYVIEAFAKAGIISYSQTLKGRVCGLPLTGGMPAASEACVSLHLAGTGCRQPQLPTRAQLPQQIVLDEASSELVFTRCRGDWAAVFVFPSAARAQSALGKARAAVTAAKGTSAAARYNLVELYPTSTGAHELAVLRGL